MYQLQMILHWEVATGTWDQSAIQEGQECALSLSLVLTNFQRP